ncbi:hypothetical protein [Hymenobacter lapidarius]|uniref:hypothetical protein n=1 Tax=Hymenobacter lapidarius TaxID=1908237 RepID=UPI000F7A1F22|nr:hypothetical protein [Hymenobacter lapidarius]
MPTRSKTPYRTEQANAAARAANLTRTQAYTRERRLLALYTRHLYALSTDTDALLLALFGPNLSAKRLAAATDRLDYDVPALLQKLRYEEQEEVLALLSADTPDLVAVARAVLRQERKLLQREPLAVLLNDEPQYRAAGLGRLTSENYGRLRPGYLPDLLPEPKQLVLVTLPRRKPAPRRVNPWVQGLLFSGGFGAVGTLLHL